MAVSSKNIKRSVKRLTTMAAAMKAGKLYFPDISGRDGKPLHTAKQWARIVATAAKRLEASDPYLEDNARSAQRLLKLARRFDNQKTVNHTKRPEDSYAAIARVAAQRLLIQADVA